MRFLLDENISPQLVGLLAVERHDVVHLQDLGLKSAPDPQVLDAANTNHRVLISADTDFGAILAARHATAPSMLLLRRAANRRVAEQARLILDNLEPVIDDLQTGAIVVLGERTIRIRRLPI